MRAKCKLRSNEILIKFTRSSHEIRVVVVVIVADVERERKGKQRERERDTVFVCVSEKPFFFSPFLLGHCCCSSSSRERERE